MLKPVPMSKVAVVGPKTQLPSTIDVLHDLNVLHIDDYTPGETGFELGSPLPGGAPTSERLLRLRGILKAAQFEEPAQPRKVGSDELSGLERQLAVVEGELGHLVERRAALGDRDKQLSEEAATLARIQNFPLPVELLLGYRSIATVAGFVPKGTDLARLQAVDPNLEYLTSEEAEGTFVAAFAPRSAEKPLQDRASKLQFQPVELAASKGVPVTRLGEIRQERERLDGEIQALESKMATIREQHALAFFALDEALAIESEKATSPVRFRTTANSFMVEGWVPTDRVESLRAAVQRTTGDRTFVTELTTKEPAHHAPAKDEPKEHAAVQEPPVMLRNPRTAAPYELLTDTYSRPRFKEIDPTLFFTIGFPLFYGFMLGDVGYGLLLLVLVGGGVFTRMFKVFGFQSTWHLNRIFLHSGLASMLFGFVYGEFFGIEFLGPSQRLNHETNLMEPTGAWFVIENMQVAGLEFPVSRLHAVKPLLLVTLAIAAIHLVIGLALGLRNGAVAHGWKAAIKHRGGWLLVMLAAAFGGAAFLPGILEVAPWIIPNVVASKLGYVALVLFLAGVGIIVWGEGVIAVLELPTVLSNLLSYTRLVAIGLSGVGIALAGNKIAGMIMGPSPLSNPIALVLGALVLLFFHGLNLALGVLGPAIHSLRLHYVEFFTKFYEGGGEPYSPFGASRRYTVKEVKQA